MRPVSTAIAKGYDFSFSRPSVSALKAAGAKFVIRYLSTHNESTAGKILFKAEASRYRSAGLDIVSNFEWYTSRAREGRAAGVADAKTALAQHKAAGGVAGRPVFFSVDEDVSGASVIDYFRGVNSVLGVGATGVYGSYRVVKYLMDHGVIGKVKDGSNHFYAWQCYAWSYGSYDERCCLAQDKNGVKVGGADCDLDTAHSKDYGQWSYNTEEADTPTVKQIWNTDNLIRCPSTHKPTNKNDEYWWPQTFIRSTWDHAHGANAKLDTVKSNQARDTAKLDAIKKAVESVQTPAVDSTAVAKALAENEVFVKNLAAALASHVKVA